MDYDEALAYLQGRLRLGVKLGNDRFLALLERLGNPQDRLRVVHIAGTKGKGSTTAMAASVLQAAGCRVGMYLSPYVYDVRERIQINGAMISRADFARWVTLIVPHIAALEQTEFGPTTEFELKTAVGLCYFAEQAVDYAVLEVGLGGRLDATNVITRPLVTVITNIGLDHTELLGHTLGAIAGEKAGIVKPGIPCVTGVPVGGEAWKVIARICTERNAPLLPVTAPLLGADGLRLTTPRRTLSGLNLRLRGAFQELNAAAALSALDAITDSAGPTLSDDAARQGLESAWVPGRLEQVWEHPVVVLDVAHNEISAHVLANALRDQHGADTRRLHFSRRSLPKPCSGRVSGTAGGSSSGSFDRHAAGVPPASGLRCRRRRPTCRLRERRSGRTQRRRRPLRRAVRGRPGRSDLCHRLILHCRRPAARLLVSTDTLKETAFMPHQGIVALSISAFSIFLTLCVLFYTLREEKKNQARNPSDKH